MPLPRAVEARPYYRAAKQRFDDASFLLEANRTTGTVYLAGYGVECMLKALILSLATSKRRQEILKSFRGGRAHDFDWLRKQLMRIRSISIPAGVSSKLSFVNTWTTELRYKPGSIPADEAQEFVAAVEFIMHWADGRMA